MEIQKMCLDVFRIGFICMTSFNRTQNNFLLGKRGIFFSKNVLFWPEISKIGDF